MKAPEKLYLDDDDELFDLFPVLCLASTEKHDNEVEYIRKDVFIEKARKYFIKELPNFRSFMESGEIFIKNFESFMQGE